VLAASLPIHNLGNETNAGSGIIFSIWKTIKIFRRLNYSLIGLYPYSQWNKVNPLHFRLDPSNFNLYRSSTGPGIFFGGSHVRPECVDTGNVFLRSMHSQAGEKLVIVDILRYSLSTKFKHRYLIVAVIKCDYTATLLFTSSGGKTSILLCFQEWYDLVEKRVNCLNQNLSCY